MNQPLKNTTLLITGATSGIGEACAVLFAEMGAKLILCARREERLNQLKARLVKDYQSQVHLMCLDVRDHHAVNQAVEQLPADFQRIDVLINNAGGAVGTEYLRDGHIEDWETMLDANVKGVLYFLRAVLPKMYAQNSGHVINIGSTAAHNVYPTGSVYCASKHAVSAITKTLSQETINTGIRVTEIDPGMVETEFSLVRFKGDSAKAKALYSDFQPLSAMDVADAIAYAITRPAHVNIAQIVMYSREQKMRLPD
jgi:3-hydroxy acid dehydrogenase/malonic semialdehyde reductase